MLIQLFLLNVDPPEALRPGANHGYAQHFALTAKHSDRGENWEQVPDDTTISELWS